ncbi:hypothetical protein NBE99_01130 [Thermosynechococcus sp. HN-54]|uniref:hypothetical protein n=1 Tax=Thermosynechococcus sp. HN-54 TaxID=2933959 RepID=UPI00202CB30B|nr:hypothetical protein [Thermosynechococcus sp. HN-54]URR35764.1 hypothetical protein NBE99_01130 [Thermosynechococcus sp. HN-54]
MGAGAAGRVTVESGSIVKEVTTRWAACPPLANSLFIIATGFSGIISISPPVITYSPSPEPTGTVNDRPIPATPTLPLPHAPQTQQTFVAEAPLHEALTRIWEQARATNVRALASLEIRLYDPNDAFVILAYVRQLPETKTTVSWQGSYQTVAGSHLEFEYEGDFNRSRVCEGLFGSTDASSQ